MYLQHDATVSQLMVAAECGLAVSLYGAKLAKKAEKQKNFAKTFSLTKSYFSAVAQG